MTKEISALSVLALIVSPSWALSPAVSLDPSTVALYVAGSAIVTPVLDSIMKANCTANTLSTYIDASGGNQQRAYSCTVSATDNLGMNFGLAARNVVIYKRDLGGSVYGVNPVALSQSISFLDLASCGISNVCSGLANFVPMLGVSDVEPSIFQDYTNLPSGAQALTSSQLGNLKITPVLQTVFGVAVTNKFYAALQSAQNVTDQPSLTLTQVASLLANPGIYQFESGFTNYTGAADAAAQVNVCRLKSGSGTQVASNIMFGGGCYSKGLPVKASDSDATTPGNGSQAGGGYLYVNEGGTSSDVVNCLNATNAAGGYGVANLSFTTQPKNTDGWGFVKLDGNVPSSQLMAAARYNYTYENSFQYNSVSFLGYSAALKGLINGLISEAGNESVWSALPSAVQNGIYPISKSYVSRGGNSCAILKIVK